MYDIGYHGAKYDKSKMKNSDAKPEKKIDKSHFLFILRVFGEKISKKGICIKKKEK